jgi:hypothetical protein
MPQPDFTGRTIFRIGDPNALKLVNELGFGNIASSALSVLTIINAARIVLAASRWRSSTRSPVASKC